MSKKKRDKSVVPQNSQHSQGSTTYLAVVAYDGSNYSGWQSQAGASRTVQGTLAHAAKSVFKKEMVFDGSGRTDAGVHAHGQTVSFVMEGALPTEKVKTILNHVLPEDIRIRSVREMPYGYHARYDAVGKTYVYRILVANEVDAFDSRYFHYESRNLDMEAMRRAARYFCGTKDFKNFCATGSNKKTTVRRLRSIEIKEFGREEFLSRCHTETSSSRSEDCRTSDEAFTGVDETWMWFEDGVREIDAHGIATWGSKNVMHAGVNAAKPNHKPVRVIELRFTGDGFLYKMVRMIVAALLDVGRGRIPTDAVPGLFTKKDRVKEAAPPNGLYLERVYYKKNAPPRMPHLKKSLGEKTGNAFEIDLDCSCDNDEDAELEFV